MAERGETARRSERRESGRRVESGDGQSDERAREIERAGAEQSHTHSVLAIARTIRVWAYERKMGCERTSEILIRLDFCAAVDYICSKSGSLYPISKLKTSAFKIYFKKTTA